MITRKTRKALRQSRQGKQCGYVEVLRQGEKAFSLGRPITTNPYAFGTENFQTWQEGYLDAYHALAADPNVRFAK